MYRATGQGHRLACRTDVGDRRCKFPAPAPREPRFPACSSTPQAVQGPRNKALVCSFLLAGRDFLLRLFFCLYLYPVKYDKSRLFFSQWSNNYTMAILLWNLSLARLRLRFTDLTPHLLPRSTTTVEYNIYQLYTASSERKQ